MISKNSVNIDPSSVKHTLAVIVPAYNEENTIARTIEGLKSIVPSQLPSSIMEFKVIVINDGSVDNTAQVAESAGADIIVQHGLNRGLGAAVRSGLIAARNHGATIAVKFDADAQHDPSDIPALVSPILEDNSDIVYGNRFEKISYRMPFIRRVGNYVFTKLMKWLTGWPLKDSQPGIFAANERYLENFYIPGDYNYTQQILLDAFHRGLRFSQICVSFYKRESGQSFVSINYPYQVGLQILNLLVSVKPMRVFAPVGFVCISLALLIAAWQIFGWFLSDAPKPIRNVNLVLGLSVFGLQTFFFGLLAELIVNTRKMLQQNNKQPPSRPNT